MKNITANNPTVGRYLFGAANKAIPKVSSAIPERTTTRSTFNGNHAGTWALNSARKKVRWAMPVKISIAPINTRAIFLIVSFFKMITGVAFSSLSLLQIYTMDLWNRKAYPLFDCAQLPLTTAARLANDRPVCICRIPHPARLYR
jgi:hypothetical protein